MAYGLILRASSDWLGMAACCLVLKKLLRPKPSSAARSIGLISDVCHRHGNGEVQHTCTHVVAQLGLALNLAEVM